MQGADKGIEQELDGLGLHIGIVQAPTTKISPMLWQWLAFKN